MIFHNLFDTGGVFLRTEHYILRRILPEEKSDYEKLAAVSSSPEINAPVDWDTLLSEDHMTCSILQKETGAFCGFCQLQWVFAETPELGIELLPAFQHQGITAEILLPFLMQALAETAFPDLVYLEYHFHIK